MSGTLIPAVRHLLEDCYAAVGAHPPVFRDEVIAEALEAVQAKPKAQPFTGQRPDKLGRRRCYVRGKLVKCGGQTATVARKQARKATIPSLPAERWKDAASPQEMAAVQNYAHSGSDAYWKINDALRSGKPVSGNYQFRMDRTTGKRVAEKEKPTYAQTYEGMRSLFQKLAPFSKPMTVYRGIGIPAKDVEKFLANLKRAKTAGTNIAMKGFTSTGKSREAAESYSSNTGFRRAAQRMLFEIAATKGLEIKDVNPDSKESEEYAQEVILNHGSKFKVRGLEQRGDFYVIKLEQVA